jgi:hypothetical protein
MGSKDVVNIAAKQPGKKHWVRHAIVVILLTLVVLVAWMAYTSLMHKAV